MYVVLAALGLLRANRWVVLAVTIVWALTATLWSQRFTQMLVVYNFDVRQVFLCGTYFMVGAVFQRFGLERWYSLSNTLAAATILLCLERSVPLLQHAAWVLLPFVVLSFGLAHSPLLERLTRRGDYSYGMYIYAFPIQQAVAYLEPDIGIEAHLLVCFVVAVLLAALSWHLVERHALALKPRKPERPGRTLNPRVLSSPPACPNRIPRSHYYSRSATFICRSPTRQTSAPAKRAFGPQSTQCRVSTCG
jgi:peptidoglycan/LPS O-acetylase OafA/YrhL